MYINRPNFSKTNGFTLVEIAIVLVIVGLLITGLIMPLAAQYDLKNYNETRTRLATIKEAIVGFAIVNGRLPCPADGAIASGVAGAGTQNIDVVTGTCNSQIGVVPWVDLGVLETDAWNRRYTYEVTLVFSDTDNSTHGCITPPNPLPTSSFALCSSGSITIKDSSAEIAKNIPVVIVSHGKNGYGAYLSNGLREPDPNDKATSEEKDNFDITTPPDYVFTTASLQGYDDLVDWVSPNVLFNRMVTAGRLP